MTVSEQRLRVCVIKKGGAVQGDRTMAVLTIRAYPYDIASSSLIYQTVSEMSVCVQAVPIPMLILRVAEAAHQTTPVKEKSVMRKARNTLRSVVTAMVILGMIAVVGHAQKVVQLASKPVPTASVSGGIVGQGDPSKIRIMFNDPSFVPAGYPVGTIVISNPDYPPSLNVYSATRLLSYYYCDGPHKLSDQICDIPAHSPDHYKRLRIYGGIPQKRINQVSFPVGSTWEIACKTDLPGADPCYSGVLTQAVIYGLTR